MRDDGHMYVRTHFIIQGVTVNKVYESPCLNRRQRNIHSKIKLVTPTIILGKYFLQQLPPDPRDILTMPSNLHLDPEKGNVSGNFHPCRLTIQILYKLLKIVL
jgi:hypothetical protein